MYIIIKNKNRSSIKGRSVTEFCDNLVSNGWPDEFNCDETKERAKFIEKREGRPLTKRDLTKISREMQK